MFNKITLFWMNKIRVKKFISFFSLLIFLVLFYGQDVLANITVNGYVRGLNGQIPTGSITFHVQREDGGSGTGDYTATPNGTTGAYTFTIVTGTGSSHTYTITIPTPPSGIYDFSPASIARTTVNNVTLNNIDFRPRILISGTTRNSNTGAGINGVILTLGGDSSGTTAASAGGGLYSIAVPYGGSYTLINAGYWSLLTQPFTSSQTRSAITGADFLLGTAVTINGRVYDRLGGGLAGVTITFTTSGGYPYITNATAADGSYTDQVPASTTFNSATPALTGYTFVTSQAIPFTTGATGTTSRNWTPMITISGTIASGVTLNLGTDSTGSVLSASGSYTITVPRGRSYTLTSAGYTSVLTQPFAGSTSNITGADFYGLPIIVGTPSATPDVTTATINATVNANNSNTTVTFEYGLNTSYGSSVAYASNPVTGVNNTAVVGNLSGLTNNTLYHYRVKAVNSAGTVYNSGDLTFTTLSLISINGMVYDRLGGALSNVTITVARTGGDNGSWTTTTAVDGSYSITNIPNATGGGSHSRTYTVTPSLTGYTFSPVNRVYTGNYDYSAIPSSNFTPLITISGTITSGVTLTLGTDSTGSVVSAGGTYTITVPRGRSYTLTSAGYTSVLTQPFTSPATLSNITGANFYALPTIVGTPTATPTTNTATINATVNANNSNTTVTVDYGLTASYGSSVTCTPNPVTGVSNTAVTGSLSGLTINTLYHYQVRAVNAAGTVTTGDLTFTTLNAITLNGRVYDRLGGGLGGVTITITRTGGAPNSWTTTTAANGSYADTIPNAGASRTYTITPSLAGYTFFPTNRTYTANYDNSALPSSNFTPLITISGTITSGVTLNLGTDSTGSVLSAGGTYTITVPRGRSYTLTSAGYISVITQPFASPSTLSNITGADFYTLPTATTNAATNVVFTTATLNGTINANNSSTTVTFEYGTTISYGSTVTATQSPVSGTTNTAVSFPLTGLTQGTLYHYRVVGVNGGGRTNGGDQTFTTLIARTISGSVVYPTGGSWPATTQGMPGVTITLTSAPAGGTTGTVLTGSDGTFSFSVIPGYTYTVTPTKTDLGFTPTSLSQAISTSDWTGLTFTLSSSNYYTYFFSGFLQDRTLNGISGVTVTMDVPYDGITISTVSNSNGFYMVGRDAYIDRTHTVIISPTSIDWSWQPTSYVHSGTAIPWPAQNYDIDFTGSKYVRLSGTINPGPRMPATPNVIYQNVQIIVTGPGSNTPSVATMTDQNGTYSVLVEGGDYTYTATASKDGFTYSSTPIIQNPTTDSSFAAILMIPNNVVIRGNVSNGGLLFGGVTVTLTGTYADGSTAGGVIVTKASPPDSLGRYKFTIVNGAGGNYTVTPTLSPYTFFPVSQTFNNLYAAESNQDFITNVNTKTISGVVSLSTGGPLSGVLLTLSGDLNAMNMSATDGSYQFTVNQNGTYQITPSKSGYIFVPFPAPINKIYGDTTVNFAAYAQPFTITGMIDSAAIAPWNNVTVRLDSLWSSDGQYHELGGRSYAGGNYTLTVYPTGSYQVRPTATYPTAGYGFIPQNVTFANPSLNHIQNFSYTANARKIAGTISLSTTGPLQGVTVSLSGSSTGTTVTDASGKYEFSAIQGGNYTINASKTSFKFTPPAGPVNIGIRTITNLASDQLSEDFTAYAQNISISGVVDSLGITPWNNVTVHLDSLWSSDGQYHELAGRSYAGGNYTLTVSPTGSYQVRPTATYTTAGFSFIPPSETFTNLSSNQTQNFTYTASGRKISGVVTLSAGGPLSGVLLTLTGDLNTTTVSAADGSYLFSVNQGGTYLMTPSKTGYTFLPSTVSVNKIYNDTTVNFMAPAQPFTITGTIDSMAITPWNNVTVHLDSLWSSDGQYHELGGRSYSGGNYTLTVYPTGNYRVRPTATYTTAGYNFIPQNVTFANPSSNQVQNFSYTANARKIAGTISLSTSGPLQGVTVTLSGSSTGTTVTDASGKYEFAAIQGGNYTINATRTSFRFTPPDPPAGPANTGVRTITNLASDQLSEDFTAYTQPLYISGVIDSLGITPWNNVTVYLDSLWSSDGQYHELAGRSFAGGNYTLTVYPTGSYQVRPTATYTTAGYSFIPPDALFANLSSNQIQNFKYTVSGRKISGVVSLSAGGPLSGVLLTLSGNLNATTVSATDGSYEFSVNQGGTYQIAPGKTGYTFLPSPAPINKIYNDTTVNFTAYAQPLTITGTIDSAAITPWNNVTVHLDSLWSSDGQYHELGGRSYSGGNYTLTVYPTGNYRVRPTATYTTAGYSFIPQNVTFANPSSPQTQNFSYTANARKIAGTISLSTTGPLQGVTVTLSGSSTGTTVTDASGKYEFAAIQGGNYTINATKTSFKFTPPDPPAGPVNTGVRTITNLASDQLSEDFTAYAQPVSVSGVIDSLGITSWNNVTVHLDSLWSSDGQYHEIAGRSYAGGNYTLIVYPTGSYQVRPTATYTTAGYSFVPPSALFANPSSNQTQNFKYTASGRKISGLVNLSTGGALSGVLLTLTGNLNATTVSVSDGSYEFTVNQGGTYQIAPSKSGYTFLPSPATINKIYNDTTVNFAAYAQPLTITGAIDSMAITPWNNVTVHLDSLWSSDGQYHELGGRSYAGGNYTLTVYPTGNYRVRPTPTYTTAGYSFIPQNVTFANPSSNQVQNFSYTANARKIAGTISLSSSPPLQGVTVTLSGSSTGTTVTDASGKYEFAAIQGGNYTINATKTSFKFTPPDPPVGPVNTGVRTITNLTSDQLSEDFTAYAQPVSISGVIDSLGITPWNNVTVHLDSLWSSDGQYHELAGRSYAGGNYTLTVYPTGSYQVRPTATYTTAGYSFVPPDALFANPSSNQIQNFKYTASGRKISGLVSLSTGGALSGVLLTLTGDLNATTVTATDGSYEFTVNQGGIYQIAPSKSGYTFTPSPAAINKIYNDTTVNFTASAQPRTITGVIDSMAITPWNNVTVHLDSLWSSDGQYHELGGRSYAGGNYTLTVYPTGNYRVRPTATYTTSGYVFIPQTATFANPSSNQVQNFSYTANARKIAGTILLRPPDNRPLQGVTLTLSGSADATTVTDAVGKYEFSAIQGGNYTITAAKTGYKFSPPATPADNGVRTITNLASDQLSEDFTAYAQPFTITGTIDSLAITPWNNVTVHLDSLWSSDGQYHELAGRSFAGGNYTLTVYPTGNYRVRPTPTYTTAGYIFIPQSALFANPSSNQTQNFTYSASGRKISGLVSLSTGGALSGVLLTLTGDLSATTVSASDGSYELTVNQGGTYQLAPTKSGFTFLPSPAPINKIYNDTTVNFTAYTQPRTITGVIDSMAITPWNNVTVHLDSLWSSDGQYHELGGRSYAGGNNYTLTVYPTGNYRVRPTATYTTSGYVFIPQTATFANPSSNQVQNFSYTANARKIAGTILLRPPDNRPLQGVTLTLSGSADATTVTDGSGKYEFSAIQGGNYTITAAKTGYKFSPPATPADNGVRTITNLASDQLSEDFTAYTQPFTITGVVDSLAITPWNNVTVHLDSLWSGDGQYHELAGRSFSGGNYTLTVYPTGNYRVRPTPTYTTAGYIFIPQSALFANPSSNQTQNYTYSASGRNISGVVSLSTGGALSGVLLTLTGDLSATTVSASDGSYELTVNQGGTYQITPSKTGFTFTPSPAQISKIFNDTTVNFTASARPYTITGVVDSMAITPWNNVTVHLDSLWSSDGQYHELGGRSYAGGNYTLTVYPTGNYRVRPTAAYTTSGYVFIPQTATFANPSSNQVQNFSYTANARKIAGTILLRPPDNRPLQGVTLTLSGSADATTVTDASGQYEFSAIQGGNYTITAAKTGYKFSPPATPADNGVRTITNLASDQLSEDFTAYTQPFTITGVVDSMAITPWNNVTIHLDSLWSSDGQYHELAGRSFAGGNYTLTVYPTGSYRVRPTPTYTTAGYIFIPQSALFANPSSNQTQNFTYTASGRKISGLVTLSTGGALSGVLLTLTGDLNATTVSADNGIYQFTVNQGGTYQIAPSKSGYTFTPSPAPINKIYNDTTVNFTAIAQRYTITGAMDSLGIPFNHVTLSLDSLGGSGYVPTGRTITPIGGNYTIDVYPTGSYKLTPTATYITAGYSFVPQNAAFVNPSSNQTQNFTYNASGRKVNGLVSLSTGGSLSGVLLTLTGDLSATTVTASDGSYEFTVNQGGTYQIAPSKTGYTFTPPTAPVVKIYNDTTVNFTAHAQRYTITGIVDSLGIPFNHVTLSLDSLGGSGYVPTGRTATPIGGNYTIDVYPTGSYKLTPASTYPTAGYSFIPQNAVLANPSSNQTQNFTYTASGRKISGLVSLNIGGTLSGVLLTLTGDLIATTVTASDGSYQFTVNQNGTYQIVPGKTGYTFSPPAAPVVKIYNDTTINFTASRSNYTIIGTVFDYNGTTPLQGAVLNCPGTPESPLTTGIDGTYSFTVNVENDYTITPTKAGYSFFPVNRQYHKPSQNYTAQDFKAVGAIGPVLKTPPNNSVGIPLNPTFTWDPPQVGSAPTGYLIQVSTSTLFTSFVGGSNYIVNASTFSWTVQSNLNNGTIYYWRVQALTPTGNNWSDIWNFTTISPVPIPQSPINDAMVSVQPTLIWTSSSGASTYDVEVNTNSNHNPGTMVNLTGNYGISSSRTTFDILPALSNGIHYYWRVRANNGSVSGSWSNVAYPTINASFITNASIPTLKFPPNASNGLPINLTFEWYPVTGATKYTLQYSTDPSFSTKIERTDITGTTQSETNLNLNTTYFWRVKVQSPAESAWSDMWYFSVGGSFSWYPSTIDYGSVVTGRVKTEIVHLYNNGANEIIISNLEFTDPSNFNSPNITETPIRIPAYSSKDINVNFAPTVLGNKSGKLRVYHNVSSQPINPVEIQLTGNCVLTLARISLPSTLDMGTVTFLSDYKEKTLTVTNASTVQGDYLRINNLYFEKKDNLFQIMSPFPILIESGNSVNLTVRFYPYETGTLTNTLHISNSSYNNPEATVLVQASVVQPNLIVTPARIDFGHTSRDTASKRDTIKIQNYSPSTTYIVTSKTLSGDVSSFNFIKNASNVRLLPGQTDTVIIEFFPHTVGRKDGIVTINTSDPMAPKTYVTLTGIGGDNPVLFSSLKTIDFGDIGRSELRDTTILLRNDGSLDLNITSKKFIGNDKDLFSFVTNGNPVVLRSGQTESVKIRMTGNLPTGNKSAQLQILCNDPDNSTFIINLIANIKTNVLSKNVDRIVFDTVVVGYSADTSFILKNTGNLSVVISSFYIDGTYASDFSLSGFTLPLELLTNQEKVINVKFTPLAPDQRFARIVIKSNDRVNPEQTIVLRGTGKILYPEIAVSPTSLDFGRIGIFEKLDKDLTISNKIKFSQLRIDSIYPDPIQSQPFSFNNLTFPLTIGDSNLILKVTFNPRSKQRNFSLNLNIISNSTVSSTIKVPLIGSVKNPGTVIHLPPVLSFGKVPKDSSKTMEVGIENTGELYLQIDSMKITGESSSEFVVGSRTYPIRIDPEEMDNIAIIFTPKNIGNKIAKLVFYWNDLFNLGEINIIGEGVLGAGQTLGIVKVGEIPKEYSLSHNYPNPFNPSTRFEYGLPDNAFVSVKIYNYLGQEVETLINEQQPAGYYTVEWHPNNLSSGLYFYRLVTSKFTQLKKMVYIR